MRIGAGTDQGKAREVNQDSFYISKFNDGSLDVGYCIVADGMGGHNAGEVASAFAVEFLKDYIDSRLKEYTAGSEIIDFLKEGVKEVNTEILKKSAESESFAGMGTTVIVCIINGGTLYAAHVGDSRLYLIHNGIIDKITTDHSMVEELLNSGTITREEAMKHPKKNIITRAVGGELTIKTDIFINSLVENDIILVCTDGLTNMIKEQEILKIIEEHYDLQFAVEELIRLANLRGGLDNITVIAIGL